MKEIQIGIEVLWVPQIFQKTEIVLT